MKKLIVAILVFLCLISVGLADEIDEREEAYSRAIQLMHESGEVDSQEEAYEIL